MRSSILARGLLVSVMLTLPASAVATSETDATLDTARIAHTIESVLAADLREAPAACAQVDYGTTQPTAAAARVTRMQEPPNAVGSTLVNVFLFILAIDDIDARTNSFHFQGYGGLVWCDPRLAFDPVELGYDRKLFIGDRMLRFIEDAWWPGVIIASRIGEPSRTNDLLVVYPDGTVRMSTMFENRVAASYDFRNFPADRQTLRIPVQPEIWFAGDVVLQPLESLSGFNAGFEMPEWQVLDHRTRVDEIAVSGKDDGVTRFVMEIEIGRRVGFYVWKIVLPLLIIVAVPWSVFWMSRDALGQRQRQSATGLLTLVAFQFVAGATLPRVSYLTLIDAVFLWSFVMAASTLMFNVIHARRYRTDQDRGLRSDRRSRWLYPVVYFVGVGVIVFLHQL